MATSKVAEVVDRVRALSYFSEPAFAYSLPNGASDTQVMQALQQALADYQQGDIGY